jgi:hypothetical protein
MDAPIIGELSSDSHGDLPEFRRRDEPVEFGGAASVADSGRFPAVSRRNRS